MPSTSPIILILGAGPNIGQNVARVFAAKGYKVALAARSLKEEDSTASQLHIKSDFSKPEEIVSAFAKVRKALGIPSVVVYNAASLTASPADDPFAIEIDGFKRDMTIGTTSAFVAAQQAVLGFRELPNDAARSFFYTGNILNVTIIPGFVSAGASKSASAHIINAAAAAYKDKGFNWIRFYYVDERKSDGSAKYRVDGDAHGKIFLELAEKKEQGPWLQTFVKDVGYQDFEGLYRL
ncbi:hypothetical protein VTL71DRAFT_16033 [Oculimacula yallundae]|uniref:Uncharacterized protein n=1 Tax=Oculimacula yallundae TaxID=86028 RepID=A0ABR4CDC5_9HELO